MEIILFDGFDKVAEGEPGATLQAARDYLVSAPAANLLVFERSSSQPLEVDFNLADADLLGQLAHQTGEPQQPARRGRGRPRLGVQSREVSLLPRHWDWLSRQSGGASAALRRLVEAAKRSPEVRQEEARLAVDRFLHALAGDLPEYEEALRQFYRRQYGRMFTCMADWPEDVQRHARSLVARVQQWEAETEGDRRAPSSRA